MRSVMTSFWKELRRRRVLRTTVAYIVGAWIVIEVSSVIFPIILLPDWAARIVTVLALIGLPLVAVLAWVFDIERKPASVPHIDSAASNLLTATG